jgi:peptide/nickel transport system substrate-binding protein
LAACAVKGGQSGEKDNKMTGELRMINDFFKRRREVKFPERFPKILIPLVLAVALALVVVACAGAPTPTTPPPTTQPAVAQPTLAAQPTAPPATAVPSTTSAPQKPVVIVQAEVPTLDPQFGEAGNLGNVQQHLFDFLIAYDKDMKIVPSAAESYTLLPDNKTYQFKIRRGIKFWNGEPLDAKAVKFTFDRIGNADLRKQGLNDPYYTRVGFDHIDIVDDYTVNFVLKQPTILFLVYTTFNPILAPGYYTTNTPQQTAIKPMGSGPWVFKEWVKDDHLTMTANPDYWRGKPQIETLIWRPVPVPSTRTAMLQRGEADIIADMAPEDIDRVKADSNLKVCIAPGARRLSATIPTELPQFKDKRVRQAFNYAVDFDAINKTILNGLAAGRMNAPVSGDFWIDPTLKPYTYDPDKAKALLKEAAWNPDTQVTLYTPVGRYMKDTELAQAIAGYWQKAGVKALSRMLTLPSFQTKRAIQRSMVHSSSGWARGFGPDDVSVLFQPGFQGFQWVDNSAQGPAAKKLFEELQGTFDEKKQQQLVWQITKIFADEAPWVFLWRQASVFGTNKRTDWNCFSDYRIYNWLPGSPSTKLLTQ